MFWVRLCYIKAWNFPSRRLVEKLENMRNNAIGDGKETCLLCGSKFGALKVVSKRCDICELVWGRQNALWTLQETYRFLCKYFKSRGWSLSLSIRCLLNMGWEKSGGCMHGWKWKWNDHSTCTMYPSYLRTISLQSNILPLLLHLYSSQLCGCFAKRQQLKIMPLLTCSMKLVHKLWHHA